MVSYIQIGISSQNRNRPVWKSHKWQSVLVYFTNAKQVLIKKMVKPWVVVETDCTVAALALCNKILNRHKLRLESCLHTTYILKFYLLSAHTDRYYFLSYLSTSSSFPYITFEPLSLITLFCEYSSYFTTFELPTPITSGKKILR